MSLHPSALPFVPQDSQRAPLAGATTDGSPSRPNGGRRRRRNNGPPSVTPVEGQNPPGGGRARAPVRSLRQLEAAAAPQTQGARSDHGSEGTPPRSRRRPPKVRIPPNEMVGSSQVDDTPTSTPNPSRSRKKQFGARLTDNASPAFIRSPAPHMTPATISTADMDLTTRLIYSFTHKDDALDCPICFASIHPAQPIWSCSSGGDASCWTTFHLKCIRSWALKSTKETREAFQARNEDREGEWRCPGCQTKRNEVPSSYNCFCGRVRDPKGGRLVTPHSCGDRCSRPRTCEHSCSIPCHPGPCPPCVISVERTCYCGQEFLVMRCSRLQDDASLSLPLSCGRKCSKPLSCGKHVCELECHPGECGACQEIESARCYCGKDTRQIKCGEGVAKVCIAGEEQWEGQFECGALCERPFQCGEHFCQKTCHPPSPSPPICPSDPSLILTCPCTKYPLETLPNGRRTKCIDPIPTCASTCGKSLTSCSHACLAKCHIGPCPPCSVPVSVTCRCGDTVRYVPCSELQAGAGKDILCTKPCAAMRNCGRHACGRVCCPLAVVALQRKGGKGKKRMQQLDLAEVDDAAGWHTCDLTCNKRLTCGNHLCEEPDHKGLCPPCLRSGFDELICYCGRTVMMPPIPCGTQIDCPYPCSRPPPPCGHTKTPHACHEDGDCPPCPFLTKKTCACGKNMVSNIRCSQEKVSCGKPCGKLMDCGFHQCDKLCHSDDCDTCTQVCGKPRKLCLHGCTSRCHAPSACPETSPCTAVITLRCACGRLSQPATCGACTANPISRSTQQLKCAQECLIAKRNRNLAEALGIDTSYKSKQFAATYTDELLGFYRLNTAFAAVAEKNLGEFVNSERKIQTLPHMPASRREFIHKLAEVYRMNVQEVDQEPHRSVQLIKRIDTRIPDPLLSTAVATATQAASTGQRRLGGLGELKRAPAWSAPTAPTPRTSATPPPNTQPQTPPASSSRFPNSALASRLRPSVRVESEAGVPSRWDEE